jgi:FkbM family methyltransferase
MFHKSYSIEAEDLIILRLFDAVVFKDPSRVGFYVDIGAFHPVHHSNTNLLYQRGWRGINVEPNPQHIDDFLRERPEDVTVNAGVSNRSGKLAYHRFEWAILNGFYPQDVVDSHVAQGQKYLGALMVDCLAAPDFLARYASRDIDLLNLDVETQELPVLRTWDWANRRPKVICIEIHALTMDDVSRSANAEFLINQGYVLMSRVWQSAFFIDRRIL